MADDYKISENSKTGFINMHKFVDRDQHSWLEIIKMIFSSK